MQGDHLPYYIDLDATVAFSDTTYEIHRPTGRGLRLHDPRIVERYRDHLYEQINYHKILEKHKTLKATSAAGTWTAETTALYQELDDIITRAMITAERKAGTTYSKKYDWSPALKALIQAHRFWKLKFKHSKGQAIATDTLQHTLGESNLPQEALHVTSQSQIIDGMRSTDKQMVTHRKNHKELRASHNEQLAEAIVLHRSPTLAHDSAQHIREEQKLQVLKQIMTRENISRSYRKIKSTLQPQTHTGLNRVDIPDISAKGPDLGDPKIPKTGKGPWVTITNPTEIAKVVREINLQQYHQAYDTPFGSGSLANLIGCNGFSTASQALLHGDMPELLPQDLLPETK
jgi:hypothetical protein